MYPEVVPIEGNIELVQNSGIQFVDYDLMVDWKTKDNTSVIKAIENGYFVRFSASKDEPLVRLVPKISNEVFYIDPINERMVDVASATYTIPLRTSLELYDGVWFPLPFIPEFLNPGQYGPTNWVRARIVRVTDPRAIASYNRTHGIRDEEIEAAAAAAEAGLGSDAVFGEGVGLGTAAPGSGSGTGGVGGVGGAGGGRRRDKEYYRIVLAFDTRTQDSLEQNSYLAPTERDVESGIRFKLAYTAERCQQFLKAAPGGLPWVREWAESVFRDLYQERIKPKLIPEILEQLILQDSEHEAHYLNVLAFIGFMLNPRPVHFISNSTLSGNSSNKAVNVSLILDIGNSRSCGIMVEDHPNVTRGDDDFSDTYVLRLRDLNAPEQVYSEPFASRIEFSRPNFDYDNRSARSGRADAFSWPSMVRVGTEAANLAAHREGNEGTSGITSPKRYLWNTDPLSNDRWVFNNYSYQIDSKKLREQSKEQVQRAYLNSIGCFFNTEGKAYFALDEDDNVYDNLESCYSNSSTMTFMLIEIFLHAMVQMNSLAQREQCTSKNTPRRLKAIILTTPPSMPAEEREIYRACVYEALGILWKSLGFDAGSPREFNFGNRSSVEAAGGTQINPPVPEVFMDWNEAEAGQVVYIYNESQKTYQGNCQAFIANLRRPTVQNRIAERLQDGEGNPLYSARIASLDIGGGTTDLVIKDYTFRQDVPFYASDITPYEVFKDGFKIAGDDIVHDIIKECIVTRLALILAKYRIAFKPVLQQLVGDAGSGNVRTEMLRAQFTQQILVKIAYKILFHLEHLDPYDTSCIVKGTVRDFLMDTESNPSLPVTVRRPGPCVLPGREVITYVDGIMTRYLPKFSIMDLKLSFDVAQINRVMMEGNRFNICRILTKMAEVLTAYDCDLLLLTGRSSKLPAIRSFFLQRLNLPAARIMQMHQYRCEAWYPFKHEGEFIGDPKTTTAVGALLCYLRLSHDKFPNFRFYSYPENVSNNAHYVGIIDNSNMINEAAVLYKYESARMLAHKNQTDIDDEESNFVPVNREDESFKTQLSVEIGCRLLDDPTMEATPLYKIEAYSSIDDIKQVKKALALTYNDISREEVESLVGKLDFALQDQYQSKSQELLERIENVEMDCQGYKAQLEQNLLNVVTAEVESSFDAPRGLAGFFTSKDKIAAEKQALVSARYQERYQQEVAAAFATYLETERYRRENELSELLNQALSDNITLLRDRFTRGFEQLSHKLNIERIHFSVTLKTVNRHSPYPMHFIRKNLPTLKQVESFELEQVSSDDGIDYTPYFRMYLKTISGARVKYFMDSGAIVLNGINPRLALIDQTLPNLVKSRPALNRPGNTVANGAGA